MAFMGKIFLIFLLFIILPTQMLGFKVWLFSNKPRTTTHQQMTERAILQTVADVCRSLALAEGRDFVLPSGELSAEILSRACVASDSAKPFRSSINTIRRWNAIVDTLIFSPSRHFDNEEILEGRARIKSGLDAVRASIRRKNYDSARRNLGRTLHTLQDFYSHSNWIELGKSVPFPALIKPDVRITNIAGRGTPTCGDCDGQNCKNILPSIIAGQTLTTGYFSLNPFFSKPKGKCSHGGDGDFTSLFSPKRGINKDDEDSIHGGLHVEAVNVATAATRELLQDIRGTAGDVNFLQLMGVTRSASVLCFVIDTTGSMSDDIAEVRRVTAQIIDSRRGTPEEPPAYILVPFNDPEFGPLSMTTDADIFKRQINALTATGGGDFPEMSLSGLLLALTGAPPSSDIFLFTDATAKDAHLRSTVLALIDSTKSVVNCMLTGVLGARRRRSSGPNQQNQRLLLSRTTDTQLYRDLSQASGGQAIQVSKDNLPQATSIITDSAGSAMVTLFQAVRDPGKAENFSFIVDGSLKKLTIFITGSAPAFTLTNPAGLSQNDTESSGALGTIQRVGNFVTVRLNTTGEGGQWGIHMRSTQPYTIKVIGQSGIDFLFEFVEITSGPHPGLQVLSGRPTANENAALLLTVTGGDSVTVTEVVLVPSSGAQPVNTTLQDTGRGDYLVTVDRLPEGEFTLRVSGQTGDTSRTSGNQFQRQTSTQLRSSGVVVTVSAQLNDTWEPGTDFTIPFTIASNSTGGNYTIRARNDRGFSSTAPSSVTLIVGGRAEGTVTLTAPSDTPSGTDVTLTIEAEAPGASDSNYAALRLAVVTDVSDISAPTCDVVSVNANCTGNCSLLTWELLANLTDGNGTGIESITVRQGSGTLNTTVVTGADGINVTLATYRASCCSEEVELVAVDTVGNVGTCSRSIRVVSSTVGPTVEGLAVTVTSGTPNSTMGQTESRPTTQTTLSTSTIISTTSAGQHLSASLFLPILSLLFLFLKYSQTFREIF